MAATVVRVCESDRFINPGDYFGGATPVPIPNTVVKPSRADDSGISRESRKLLGIFHFLLCPSLMGEGK